LNKILPVDGKSMHIIQRCRAGFQGAAIQNWGTCLMEVSNSRSWTFTPTPAFHLGQWTEGSWRKNNQLEEAEKKPS